MREAQVAGYKVYLYFVSTESPEINKIRVKSRATQGGHDVPADKIESRYYRSLDLLFEACQIAYQAFFFDNSTDGKDSALFAHFKREKGEAVWDPIQADELPDWFYTYYLDKVKVT